jgi:hypothetical protein
MQLIPSKRIISKLLGVLLLLALITSFLPVSQGQAAEVRDLKAYFDQLDARGGDWYRNYSNDSGFLAFREAYVMQSYLLMYERYKDTKYLDKFILHAANIVLFPTSFIYQLLFSVQIGFYSLALIGAVFQCRTKIIYIPYYFCLFNFTSIVGMFKALCGSTPAHWEKAGSTRI